MSTPQKLGVMRALDLDRVAAAVTTAFAESGIPVLLLKGRGFVKLLYGDHGARTYGDVDLLIPASHERAAESELRDLDFTALVGTGRPDPGVADNHIWMRGPHVVELHVSLIGVNAASESLWAAFAEGATTSRVGGASILTPAVAPQLLHAALHAAQHGEAIEQPLLDLDAAISRFDEEQWRVARRLSERLGATQAFATGLRLRPAGRVLAETLGATAEPDRMTALRAASAEPLPMGLGRLFEARSWTERTGQMARFLFPSPTFIRWWDHDASHSHPALLRGYFRRWIYVFRRAGPAVLEYRRITRSDRG